MIVLPVGVYFSGFVAGDTYRWWLLSVKCRVTGDKWGDPENPGVFFFFFFFFFPRPIFPA